jgi:hypothetical protein
MVFIITKLLSKQQAKMLKVGLKFFKPWLLV